MFFFQFLLHEGAFETTDCDDIKAELKEIADARTEASEACDDTRGNELDALAQSTEFEQKREDIETSVGELKESLECDDSEIKAYFDCHNNRVSIAQVKA